MVDTTKAKFSDVSNKGMVRTFSEFFIFPGTLSAERVEAARCYGIDVDLPDSRI